MEKMQRGGWSNKALQQKLRLPEAASLGELTLPREAMICVFLTRILFLGSTW